MLKVLLISTHYYKGSWSGACPVPPIGLGYIAATLQKDGHAISLCDLCFKDKDDISNIIHRAITESDPEVIGFSIRNIDNTLYLMSEFYIPFVKEIVEYCRLYTDAEIVFGGAGFSIMPEEILYYCKADIGIVGEGEYSFSKLLRKMETGEDISTVQGIIFIKDGVVVQNNPQYIENLDDIPFPSRELYDKEYYGSNRITKMGINRARESIQTKRGCSLSCIYCTYPNIEGCKIRLRSPRKVVDEMELISKEYGIEDIEIVDSIFNIPVEHSKEICEEIIRRNIKIKWISCLNPGFVDEELLSLMKKAGCIRVEFGSDSASPKILKNLLKKFDQDAIIWASNLCKEIGLPYSHYIMIGGPGENFHTVEETLITMERIDPTDILVTPGIRIYPRTQLAEMSRREGYIKEHEDLLAPHYYFSKDIDEKIIGLFEQYSKSHLNWHFVTIDNLKELLC
ncbi:MAG: radical SAM protein [bacterium]